jgi:hypothetical protein
MLRWISANRGRYATRKAAANPSFKKPFSGVQMRKAIRATGVWWLCSLMLFACGNHRIEKDFFEKPPVTRTERLRQYSLEDQYKIFRYGNDVIEPPLMELGDPIAHRGAAVVPFLLRELSPLASDITIRDILVICETMSSSGSYNVKSDVALMAALDSGVSKMKDKGWQAICLKMLQRIKDSK